MFTLPSGLGGTVDVLATAKPIAVNGSVVYWVSSLVGADGNDGTDRQAPLATLNTAIALATDDSIIVLMAGHTETTTAAITIAQSRLTIVGEGTVAGKPSVQLKNSHATNKLLDITGTDLMLRNIYFPENLILNSTNPRVDVGNTASGFRMEGCYFDVGNNDDWAFRVACDHVRVRNTTIISTATSAALRPTYGFHINTIVADLELEGLILSDGQHGFIFGAMVNDVDVVAGLRGLSVSLLLGADIFVPDSTGWVNVQTSTGGGSVTI